MRAILEFNLDDKDDVMAFEGAYYKSDYIKLILEFDTFIKVIKCDRNNQINANGLIAKWDEVKDKYLQ